MKQKIFYIVVIVCCLSLFSSAKQAGKVCVKNTNCQLSKKKMENAVQDKNKGQAEFDLSPLRLFLLSI
jgi:P pilus assembly chaperone PapD